MYSFMHRLFTQLRPQTMISSFSAPSSPVLRRTHGLGRHSAARRNLHVVGAQSPNFMDDVKRIAKKIQGALPVVGLISRLTAVDGGFDELSYPEYTRGMMEKAPEGFAVAVSELEKRYGKPGSRRFILFSCWLAEAGAGLVATSSLLAAARRVRVTEDLEVECDRFEANKQDVMKKYSYLQRPPTSTRDKVGLAADVLARCVAGLDDGVAFPAEALGPIRVVLVGAFTLPNGTKPTDAELEWALGAEGRAERAAKIV